ncbi:Short-chain dehydrogenase [Rhizobium aethiopicum]|uniref:Short-chain dehydrogenase n=1 Tax=Rhizobium aethiopicum TaxID=1138170 RepID=A0A1C3Y212_9HYPH|nr:SDR family NAD(P)-dependent oxidoreductase [Rhizobium aethiopicum]SCB58490.1 Short-chain dehydrogenase [Rhizobium aethiopicum]
MVDHESGKGLAVITGASTGIGYELAKCAARDGYDLIIAADEDRIDQAAAKLREFGTMIDAVEADLSTLEGVDRLVERITASGRSVDLLMANAGRGLGKGFLDQDFAEAGKVVGTNITGTIYLIHQIGNQMRSRGEGRILLTGSIAGFMPGSYQAVYNATKAFINSFSFALREELKDSGVTVSCLMPGATETEFFKRAGLLDTAIGQLKKDDAGEVARIGYDAMMDGEGDVVSGWKNKLQAAVANVTPASVLAQQHAKMAEPGSGAK